MPKFGNRRRTMAVALSLLVLGGVGAAVVATRGLGANAQPLSSASASTAAAASSPPPAASSAPAGPPATVQEAIHLAAARRDVCLEAARKRKPDLKGKVSIDFSITPDGEVTGEKIIESTIGDPEAEMCLLGVVRSLKVQPPAPPPPGKKAPKQIFTYTAEAG
jgi:TonB family protein